MKTWKAEYRLNQIKGSLQADAAIVDIGDGRFVAVWQDYSQTSGPSAGIDVVGQIFDAEGKRIGGEFEVNRKVVGGLETNAALASRSGGGFAAVYESDLSVDSVSIFVDLYDGDGQHLRGEIVQADDGDDVLSNPAIAMRDDGSYLVTYIRKVDADGTYDVCTRRVSAIGAVGDEVTIYDSADTTETSTDVAVLSDGNYAVLYEHFISADDSDPWVQIVGANGSTAGSPVQIAFGTDDMADVQVAALGGGGFVAVWKTDEDAPTGGFGIKASVRFSNGAPVKAEFVVNATTAGEQADPEVAALADGGFVVTWKDKARDGIYAQRFDKDGDAVGGEFLAAGAGRFDPLVAALSDGRFVTAANSATPDPDVFATIFDPRGKTIEGTGRADVLTSRKDGATIFAKAGKDVLLGQSAADILHGGKGSDRLQGGGGKDFFVFDTALNGSSNVDTITDFQANKDHVILEAGVFGALGNTISGDEFVIGTKAQTGSQHVVYDPNAGRLYYDRDGDGGAGQVLFAKLAKHLGLDSHDFLVG